MTAPPGDIRLQTSDISPREGPKKRAPYLVAGLLLAALFAWQSCLALVREPTHPRATMEDEDYPLQDGLTWIYKTSMGLQVVRRVRAQEITTRGHVITDPREIEKWFEMQYDLPLLGRKTLLMRGTREGVVAMRDSRHQLIMRFPMKPGDTWIIDFPTEDLAECTVLNPEEIDVLNKRVSASKLRVVRTNRKSGKKTTDYEWYVRGIGLAQMEVTYGITARFILERFENAK